MTNESRSPAFQFYPDKWQSHTRRLSDEAHRVFHEIMCWMWQQSHDYCSIDASVDAISCMIAMPVDKVKRAMDEIQNKHAPLFKVDNGRLVLNGLRKERKKQEIRSEKARDSIAKRWKNYRNTNEYERITNEYERITNESKTKYILSPSPTPSPITSPSTEKNISSSPQAVKDSAPDGFVEFWKTYPRKVGKGAALLAWKKNKGRPDIKTIISKIESLKDSRQWKQNNGQFIPHPATWINRDGWNDEPENYEQGDEFVSMFK